MISNGIQFGVSAQINQTNNLGKEKPGLLLQGNSPRASGASTDSWFTTTKGVQVYQEPQREEVIKGEALSELLKNKFFIHEPIILNGKKTWIVDKNGAYFGMFHSLTEIMRTIYSGVEYEK